LGNDFWPASVHLIGKDILTTHCVYWPTMLKAAGLPLPETIFGHGWWLVNEAKMSKSLGNVVKPLELVDKYGVDAFRFFLIREMSFGMDSSFSEEALLANDLGNLYSRLLKLVHSFCDGKIPERQGKGIDTARSFLAEARLNVEELKLNSALDIIMKYIRSINRFIEDTAPWKTGKTDPDGTRKNLRTALEDLATAAWCLYPIMPEKMSEILSAFGIDDPVNLPETTVAKSIKTGKQIPPKASLFPRVKYAAPKIEQKPEAPEEELVSLDEFKRARLKIARIIKAAPAPKSDKLLLLEVDIGGEKKQLVAGVAEHYKPEELIGQLIVVVTNLKPARIRGFDSEGMLLAAEEKGKLVILAPLTEVSPGSEVG